MQLMQVYVQKSTSTTCPRRAARVSGRPSGVLNQRSVEVKSGAGPRSGRGGVLTPGMDTPAGGGMGTLAASCWRWAKREGARREARRCCTAWLFSSDRVGSTRKAGRLASRASDSSKRTSRLAAMASPVRISTAPRVRSTSWPLAKRRTRPMTARPPSPKSKSTAASPAE